MLTNRTNYCRALPRHKSEEMKINRTVSFTVTLCTPAPRKTSVDTISKMNLFTFIFSFLRCGLEAKRGVEFRHSARSVSRIWQKVENGVS